MTKLSDSTVTITIGGVERELHATVDAVLKLSRGQSIAIDNQGNMVTVKGLRQYIMAIKDIDVERLLFLLRIGLDSKETEEELLQLAYGMEGGIPALGEALYPYLALLLAGGKKEEENEKKPQAKRVKASQ